MIVKSTVKNTFIIFFMATKLFYININCVSEEESNSGKNVQNVHLEARTSDLIVLKRSLDIHCFVSSFI